MAWIKQDNALYQKFVFPNFSACFAFMARVALLAEKMNHHPTFTNTYNQLELWLCTHDAGNTITQKDEVLAQAIDKLLSE